MITPFIDENATIPWSKMIVVTGIPGSRADFLSGWLSQGHPTLFQHMRWNIIPRYGISTVGSPLNWHVLTNASTDNRTIEINAAVSTWWSATADWAVSKSHQPSSILQHWIPAEHADKFIFVDIIMDTVETAWQVQWENFVKNILWNYTNGSGLGRTKLCNFYRYDLSELNDTDALLAVLDYMFSTDILQVTQRNFDYKSAINSDFDVISTEYSKLMQPNGIVELADKLGISKPNIDMWNSRLCKARSLDRIFALNKWWEKPNYPLSGK